MNNENGFKPGDRVTHYRHGNGVVLSVDITTYSIPFTTIELDSDKQYPLYVPIADVVLMQ